MTKRKEQPYRLLFCAQQGKCFTLIAEYGNITENDVSSGAKAMNEAGHGKWKRRVFTLLSAAAALILLLHFSAL